MSAAAAAVNRKRTVTVLTVAYIASAYRYTSGSPVIGGSMS
jgi:hypothetical protein